MRSIGYEMWTEEQTDGHKDHFIPPPQKTCLFLYNNLPVQANSLQLSVTKYYFTCIGDMSAVSDFYTAFIKLFTHADQQYMQ